MHIQGLSGGGISNLNGYVGVWGEWCLGRLPGGGQME